MHQAWTVIMAEKFGTDFTKYVEVTTSCFMANPAKWPPCYGNVVQRKLTVFTIMHHQVLKAFLTTFDVDLVNLLGGVH